MHILPTSYILQDKSHVRPHTQETSINSRRFNHNNHLFESQGYKNKSITRKKKKLGKTNTGKWKKHTTKQPMGQKQNFFVVIYKLYLFVNNLYMMLYIIYRNLLYI